MVAKSEASMPMSRALAKLAVATDLGTAARPSTAVPMCGPIAATGASNGNGLNGFSGSCKPGMAASAGRPLLMKPSTTRAVLAAMPLGALDNAPSSQASPQGDGGGGGAGSPTTPRLPPLPAAAPAAHPHASPPPGALPDMPLPPPSPQAQQHSSQALPPHTHAHAHPQARSLAPAQRQRQPLPLLPSPSHHYNVSVSSDIGRELLDAAKNHPGLPASLLSQLHHPRGRAGGAAPSSAPVMMPMAVAAPAARSHCAVATPCDVGKAAAGAGIKPLSPKARARATSSLTAGASPAAGPVQAGQLPPPPAPPAPPAAIASLSPEALAVLLGPPLTGQPPGSASTGGLLVMRRSNAVVGSTGVPLRPSTAQAAGVGPRGAATGCGGISGSCASAAPPTVSARPHVVPHITVPYKPGSIRLPPGTVPGLAAAAALGSKDCRPTTSASPNPAFGSTAATAAGLAGDAMRPWTAAGPLRPVTANPLTHTMAPDPGGAFVVRLPRPLPDGYSGLATAAGATAAGAALALASASASPASMPRTAHSPARSAAASPWTASPGAAAAAVPASRAGLGGGGGGGGEGAKGDLTRQLTAEELRAVLAAVMAARPQAAALLMQRPATAGEVPAQPGTSSSSAAAAHPGTASRRPYTSSGVAGALTDQGALGGSGQAAGGMGSRPGSRCSSRDRPSSRGRTAAFDDVWPASVLPSSAGAAAGGVRVAFQSRPGSGTTAAGADANGASSTRPAPASSSSSSSSACDATATADSGRANGGRRASATGTWATQRRPLQAIPEDAELAAVEEDDGTALLPLEPLEPDPELDAAWTNIVAANQRPDTAAVRAASGSINVFSRPATGGLRVVRQAAPMVLVLDDITASTPEVVERELANMSLEELQALRLNLGA